MEYIDANMPRAIELLKESVNVNSGTLNIEGVKKVGAIYKRELEKAGMQTGVDWYARLFKACRSFGSKHNNGESIC
jgi:hypothetical protein